MVVYAVRDVYMVRVREDGESDVLAVFLTRAGAENYKAKLLIDQPDTDFVVEEWEVMEE